MLREALAKVVSAITGKTYVVVDYERCAADVVVTNRIAFNVGEVIESYDGTMAGVVRLVDHVNNAVVVKLTSGGEWRGTVMEFRNIWEQA